MKTLVVVKTERFDNESYVYDGIKSIDEAYKIIKEEFEEEFGHKLYSDEYNMACENGECLYAGGIAWIKDYNNGDDKRWEIHEINVYPID